MIVLKKGGIGLIQYKTEPVTVFQSALYQTTSTVVETSDLLLVVDPTWLPHEVKEIRHYVDKIARGRPLYLMFTHSDFDHIIGYGAFPEAVTIGSKEMDEHPEKEQCLEMITQFDHKYYLSRGYPIQFPHLDFVVGDDGEELKVGQTKITFYKAPGHTCDGLFAVVDPLGLLIAGDYLSNVEFPFIFHSSEAYEDTLHKVSTILDTHKVQIMVPGHGQTTSSLAEIKHRQQVGLNYISTLRKAVIENKQDVIDAVIDGYPYHKGVERNHRQNQNLIKKELQAK